MSRNKKPDVARGENAFLEKLAMDAAAFVAAQLHPDALKEMGALIERADKEDQRLLAEIGLPAEKIGRLSFNYKPHGDLLIIPSAKEVWEFFSVDNSAVTFQTQIAFSGSARGANRRLLSAAIEQFTGGDISVALKNAEAEEADRAYMQDCLITLQGILSVHGGTIINKNPLLFSEIEKGSYERHLVTTYAAGDEALRTAFIASYPPLTYIEVRANAAALRTILALPQVQEMRFVDRASNVRKQRWERLADVAKRFDATAFARFDKS